MVDREEIKVGVTLLEYESEIQNIMYDLADSLMHVSKAEEYLNNDVYIGSAQVEMQSYVSSLYRHIDKMNTMYASLLSYIDTTLSKMDEKDAAISQWIREHRNDFA